MPSDVSAKYPLRVGPAQVQKAPAAIHREALGMPSDVSAKYALGVGPQRKCKK